MNKAEGSEETEERRTKKKVAVVSLKEYDRGGEEAESLRELFCRRYRDDCTDSNNARPVLESNDDRDLPFEITTFIVCEGNDETSETQPQARILRWGNAIKDGEALSRSFEGFDTIVYLCEYEAAAAKRPCSWTQTTQCNLSNTFYFLQECKRSGGVSKIVFLSRMEEMNSKAEDGYLRSVSTNLSESLASYSALHDGFFLIVLRLGWLEDDKDEWMKGMTNEVLDRCLYSLFISKRDCLSALERAILFDDYSTAEGNPLIVNITSDNFRGTNQAKAQTIHSEQLQRLGFYPKDDFADVIARRNPEISTASTQHAPNIVFLPSSGEELNKVEEIEEEKTGQTTETSDAPQETLLDEFEYLSLDEKKALLKQIAESQPENGKSSSLLVVARLQAIAEREMYVELLPAIMRLLLFIDGSVPTLAWLRYRVNHIVSSNANYLEEYDSEGHSQSSLLNNILLLLIVWCRTVDAQDRRAGDFDDMTIDSIIDLSIASSDADYLKDLCNVSLRALFTIHERSIEKMKDSSHKSVVLSRFASKRESHLLSLPIVSLLNQGVGTHFIAGCLQFLEDLFMFKETSDFFFTNDLAVLIEILLREFTSTSSIKLQKGYVRVLTALVSNSGVFQGSRLKEDEIYHTMTAFIGSHFEDEGLSSLIEECHSLLLALSSSSSSP